jgi:hypothetical protein
VAEWFKAPVLKAAHVRPDPYFPVRIRKELREVSQLNMAERIRLYRPVRCSPGPILGPIPISRRDGALPVLGDVAIQRFLDQHLGSLAGSHARRRQPSSISVTPLAVPPSKGDDG